MPMESLKSNTIIETTSIWKEVYLFSDWWENYPGSTAFQIKVID